MNTDNKLKHQFEDGSGTVDFNEFSKVMAEQFFKEPTLHELESAFDYFDTGKKSV